MKTAIIKVMPIWGTRNEYQAWVTHRNKIYAKFEAHGKQAAHQQAHEWAMSNGFTHAYAKLIGEKL